MPQELTIGLLARAAGVNVETIRYYQRRGLLEEPPKPPHGRRCYSDTALRRVRFIKRAQSLGFTLEEIKSLMRLDDGLSCVQTRRIAELKLESVERRLGDLIRVRGVLKSLIGECLRDTHTQSCPIITSLST